MRRESLVFLAGVLVALLPFMGFPSAWKRIGYTALGALIALLGYQLRKAAYLRSIARANGERATDAYVESPARGRDEQKQKESSTKRA